jgi:hypothetical protein
MALTHWGFIYTDTGLAPGADDVTVVESAACRSVFVGISEPAAAVDAARRLVAEGAQLIELCGAFGPVWAGRVIEAVGERVPVGLVTYGVDATDQLHTLFS